MDRKKLEEMVSEIREKAVEVDRALKSAKRRKKSEQTTPTDNDKNLPDPKETYERIISKGKPLERAILYVHNFDLKNYLGRGILTEEQRKRLRETFKTEKQEAVLREVGNIYDGLFEYSRFYLLTTRKMWESIAWELVTLCQKWEEADLLAETLTKIYYTQILPFVTKMECYTGESPYSEEAFKKYFSEVWNIDRKQGITPRVEQSGTDEEGRPLFKIVADVDGKKGLYSRIIKKREEAETILNILRGAVEPFSNYLLTQIPLKTGGTLFPYTTILPNMAESILDYPDSIPAMTEPRMEKYFAFQLRQRREKGETITPEEEKRAVIPDYNQAEEVESFMFAGKRNLYKNLPEYYDINRDYEKE